MPYVLNWDHKNDCFVIGGTFHRGDVERLHRDIDAIVKLDRRPGNWHPVLLSHMNNDRKVHAVKLWRLVAKISLKDSKDFITEIWDDRDRWPTGYEHPDVEPDALRFYIEVWSSLDEPHGLIDR